jgi:type IV pilus assembly protein PilN
VLIMLVVAGLGNFFWYYALDKKGKDIQQQITQADATQKRLAQVKTAYLEKQRQADLYKRRVDVIDQLRANQSGPANLLASLGDTVNSTEAVWLSRMTDTGAAIDLAGTALSSNAVANLMANLRKSGLFKNVEMKETVQDATVKDYQAFNFTLTCEKGKS